MIFSGATKSAPTVKVDITGGVVDDSSIVSVEVSLAENKHDMATITYAGFPGLAVTDYKGLPVKVSIRSDSVNFLHFYGYVSYVEVESRTHAGIVNKSAIQLAKVVCFGTSYQMKGLKSASYKNITLPKLLASISKKYNLSYSVPNNRLVFKLLTQTNQSDWEFLVSVCDSIGYAITASDAHLTVYDPSSSYHRGIASIPLSTLLSDNGADEKPGNVVDFTGYIGDVTPYGSSAGQTLKALDIKGKLQSHTSTTTSGLGRPFGQRFMDEITVNAATKEELVSKTEGFAQKEWPLQADVTVLGVASATPGRLVNLNRYDSAFDMDWVIAEATHFVTLSRYLTTLKLKTDSLNTSPRVDRAGKRFVAPPVPVLSAGNIWRSSVDVANVY